MTPKTINAGRFWLFLKVGSFGDLKSTKGLKTFCRDYYHFMQNPFGMGRRIQKEGGSLRSIAYRILV